MRLHRQARREARGAHRAGPAPRRQRVLILSADVGEGHAAAARALAQQLRHGPDPAEVTVIDGLASMGWLLRLVVEDGYRTQLRFIPWSYSIMYWALQYVLPFRWLIVQTLYFFGGRPLRRTIAEHDPDVVVSTYPSVTVVLAKLRRRGHVHAVTMATITDLTGLFFWAQPGIDMHLVSYPESAPGVERIAGPGSVSLVRPLIATEFLEPCDSESARRELGLPREGKVILISGGGWGVGDLDGAVRELIGVPDATLVVLAGRNESMRERLETVFASEPRVRVLGFTPRMSELLAAADALVHSTGGVTCLEANARGCPVVSYGLPVGHARVNTSAMADLDLVRLARNRRELVEHVSASCAERRRAAAHPAAAASSAADVVLGAPARVRPLSAWRLRATRLAAQGLVLVSASGWMMSTDELTAMAAAVLGRPVTTVRTHGRPEAGLIIRASQSEVPALVAQLGRAGEHASFAFDRPPSRATVETLRRAGDDALPELPRGTLLRWVGTRSDLHRDTRAMGLGAHRPLYFLAPTNMTVGQLFMARTFRGARPVVGSVRLDAAHPGAQRPLRAGDVLVVTLDRSSTSRPLDSAVASLRAAGLRADALSSLG